MVHDQKEARPRYQRQPRHVQTSTNASYHKRNLDLLGASLAVFLCIAIIWGFSFAYQTGYEAATNYYEQEASIHE